MYFKSSYEFLEFLKENEKPKIDTQYWAGLALWAQPSGENGPRRVGTMRA
jgi:hypothetical protein